MKNEIGYQGNENKLFFKWMKKQKRKKRDRITTAVLLMLLALVGLMVYTRFYPAYVEYKQKSFEILTNTDINSFKRTGTTRVYDDNQNLLGEVGSEKYEYISIKEIPDFVIKGYVAKEDRNFYLHTGVDIKANVRAVIALIENKGAITQGASTITQQVIKNSLLSQEQTYSRKIMEILLAFDMEKEFNKAQIMEFYCNSNYYGNGCYGVEGASQYYFGKKAADMDLAESAILVATSNLPNEYNPVADYDKCMEQKKLVLDQMLECEYITSGEYEVAVTETPEIVQQNDTVNPDNYMTTYAIHCAAIKVMELKGFTFRYTFTSQEDYENYHTEYENKYNAAVEEVRNGGYEIHTSLNTSIQRQLQESIDENLKGFTETENDIYKLQGAAVCVENETGMVVAIVGGREKQGSFNRGYQAVRQSGSSIKPLLDYAPAINEGVVTPGSIMDDKAVDYNGYAPHNAYSGYIGATSVRKALLKSINTIAVQLLAETGIATCYSYLDKLHFSTLTYSDSISMSIALGGFTNGVTVADMAKGYAAIANGGQYIEETCLVSMVNYNNTINYTAKNSSTEVYTSDTAFMMQDMMQQLFEEKDGAGYKYKTSKQHYAGKTGTTNNTKDVWFCGFSPYYTTAVWIGYDNPETMSNVTSGTYPTKIWTDFMESIHAKLNPKDYTVPDGVLLSNGKKEKNVDYATDIYHSRPAGWDYVSVKLKEQVEKHLQERQNQEILRQATEAVEAFESFQITSIEGAQKVLEYYNAALTLVEQVASDSDRQQLMERIAFKYDLLNNEVLSKWNDVIDEYNDTLRIERENESRTQAQESIEQAEQAKNNEKIKKVQYYITWLNQRTVYTDTVEDMIKDAKKALKACVGLPEYQQLAESLDQAIEYAQYLPYPSEDDEDEDE